MTSDLDLLRIDRAPLPPSNPAGSWPRMGRWVVLGLVFLGAWLFRRPLLQQLDAWTLPQVSLAVAHVPDPASQLKISGVAANGYVVARTRAALSAEEPGVIVEMLVSEGSRVKQGDLLARLDAREREASLRAVAASLVVAQAGVAEAEARVIGTAGTIAARQAELAAGVAGVQSAGAQLLLAEQNLARVQELEQQGAETRARLDQATAEQVRFSADYEAAQANQRSQDAALSLAQAQRGIATAALARAQALVLQREAERDRAVVSLEKRFVRAPFDGIVVLKDAEVGEVVSPNAFGSSSRGAVVTLVDFATSLPVWTAFGPRPIVKKRPSKCVSKSSPMMSACARTGACAWSSVPRRNPYQNPSRESGYPPQFWCASLAKRARSFLSRAFLFFGRLKWPSVGDKVFA